MTFNRTPLTIGAFALSLSSLLLVGAAQAAPKKHSKVVITDGGSCAKTGGAKKTLQVKVVPDSGLVVNTDGHWKLTAKNPKGLKLAKTTWEKADFDKSMPGFKVAVECTAKPASFDYQIMAFVCTKDKKLCYFDRHEGNHTL